MHEKNKKRRRAWNAGKKWSREVIEKIKVSKASISLETRKKMSESAKKRGIPRSTVEAAKKANTGKIHTPEHIEKCASKRRGIPNHNQRGSKHPNWRGGITKESMRVRNSIDSKIWRESVFKRDDYTCQHCGARGVKLNADHIKPFSLYPDLRFNIDNGCALCEPCHRLTPTFAGRIKSNYTQAY